MSSSSADTPARPVPPRFAHWRWRGALVACALLFGWAVAQFYEPPYGFTSLISIGDMLNSTKVTALRQVPHYVYEKSAGYDGAYYVQLALYPTLDNPELKKAIDNLPYRARRILFCWVEWLLGLGQPAWIVQAHALLNVLCWFVLAVVLLRWFPPTDGTNFLRWFGVMFSHGLCMSVRHSLVDGPSLLLVAVAIALVEKGRRGPGTAVLALAGLGRETSLLAVAGFAPTDPNVSSAPVWRRPQAWIRLAVTAVVVALPLLAWTAALFWKLGPADDPAGVGNFGLPLAGLAEKWGTVVARSSASGHSPLDWATLAVTLALTVQWLFFVLRWRPAETWWRVGAAFAVLMTFLSTPVWEGFPGAGTRVLLPMTLAFNLVVPRGRRWLPVLLAGNLTVLAAWFEFNPPPRDFVHVVGEGGANVAVQIGPATGWSGSENHDKDRWRWSSGEATLRIRNDAGTPVILVVQGRIAAVDNRHVRAFAGEAMVWSGAVGEKPANLQFGCVVPAGESALRFSSDRPGRHVGQDPRLLAFSVYNLEIVVRPAPVRR